MRYQKLPIEKELEKLQKEKDGDKLVEQTRNSYFRETVRTQGFQLIICLLRDLDILYSNHLRCITGPNKNFDRLIGRIQGIEEIRRSLTALLPQPERSQMDWADDEEEEYVNVDDSEPKPEENQEGLE